MNKSSVSIPYFVGIILGIIVLAIASYVIYIYVIKSSLSCSGCSAELAAWCVKCYKMCGNADWHGENLMPEKLSECIVRCKLRTSPYGNCDSTSLEFCKAYIPL